MDYLRLPAMWQHTGIRRKLLAWCLIGVVLDCVAFAGLWLLLNAVGPLNHAGEAWLDALALVIVPALIHVLALPTIFTAAPKNWIGISQLAASILLFVLVAGMLIPLLGYILFLFWGLLFVLFHGLATGNPLSIHFSPPTLADQILSYFTWTAIATIVAAIMGWVLHAFSASTAFRTPRLSARSDVLGAAVAAFLAFSGMFAASAFGLFSREVPNDPFHVLSIAPQLLATLAIGVTALFPHLLMVGLDTLDHDAAKLNGGLTAGTDQSGPL